MKNKYQKMTSYQSASNTTVYEIKQYHKPSNDWYIVGDSSMNRDYILTMIEIHNLKLLKSK